MFYDVNKVNLKSKNFAEALDVCSIQSQSDFSLSVVS